MIKIITAILIVSSLTGCYCRKGNYGCYLETGQFERLKRELHLERKEYRKDKFWRT
jgi:hypothetical protein